MTYDLLSRVKTARWHVAFRTYGNNHATLIGLIVDWWISGEQATRWALEGGPSFGYNPKGLGGGICDAILGQHEVSLGVVEVEGTRYVDTLRKIGRFFSSDLPDLSTLTFGIFLAYAYAPQGIGRDRRISRLPLNEEFVPVAIDITGVHPGKQLVILALEKTWERHSSGPRSRNEYYMATPSQIRGVLIENGKILARDTLSLD